MNTMTDKLIKQIKGANGCTYSLFRRTFDFQIEEIRNGQSQVIRRNIPNEIQGLKKLNQFSK